jgi:hypothetical protein
MPAFAFEASGQLTPPTAQELADADQTSAILCFTNGELASGEAYYAYIAVTPSKYRAFKSITASRQTMVLNDYGTVIAAGYTLEAPPETIREMHEKYGFTNDYEEKLLQRILAEQKIFFKQQEDARIANAVEMLKALKPAT